VDRPESEQALAARGAPGCAGVRTAPNLIQPAHAAQRPFEGGEALGERRSLLPSLSAARRGGTSLRGIRCMLHGERPANIAGGSGRPAAQPPAIRVCFQRRRQYVATASTG